ncbi:MAG: hypothetical protein KC609_06135 [Myxococcales bacterium]|nr:hypothetical protein [Myxococcales bacterium]
MLSRLALFTSILLLVAACSGGGNTTNPGGPTGTLAANCHQRCLSKASSCGAPTSYANEGCDVVCSHEPTEPQAQCLESSSCNALIAAFTGGGPICGIGEPTSSCGDGTCDSSEVGHCPADCPPVTRGTCGDGVCGDGETQSNCPKDCKPTSGEICGDGVCGPTEELSSCPQDCKTQSGGEIGDSCSCSEGHLECLGTDSGCRFDFGGESLRCFVNSDKTSKGYCSKVCDPAKKDDCPNGTSCTMNLWFLDGTTILWRCR